MIQNTHRVGRRTTAQLLLALGIGLLSGIGIMPPSFAQEDFKMAIVLPGIITDKAWNQAGYEGLVMAEAELGIEIAYDVAKSKEATLALFSSGADIVYQSFDSAFLGVFEAAKEGGAYTFGNVKDQLEFGPEVMLTSTVQNISLALKDLAAQAVAGQIAGEDYIIGLENSEVVSLGEFGPMVPEEVRSKAMAAVEGIQAGEIGFEDCTIEGEETWCIK